jgi:hypothetical protein
MSDSEEEIEVKVFLHRGTKYYIQEKTGDIFDIKTNEFIGKFNKKTDQIEDVMEQEEEEEEDEDEKALKKFRQDFLESEKKREAREYEDDEAVRFRLGTFLGFKTARTNKVYNQVGVPYGMYDPKTGNIDTNKKPEPLFDEREEEEEEDPDTEVEEEDETEVEIFTHEGKKYFIDPKTNKLYDIKTEEYIGKWNEKKKVIEEVTVEELDDMIDDLTKEIDEL